MIRIKTGLQVVLRGSVVFPQADQDVIRGEVFIPGRIKDAVSCSQDPLITEQTGSTQKLLWATFVQHHLPANKPCFYFVKTGNEIFRVRSCFQTF